MAGRRVVAVAGTHGKTTTTSLLTVALQAAGADPTYAIGGELTATGINAGRGDRRPVRRGGRRERRRLPRTTRLRRDRDQRRGRPPRQLGHRGGLRARRSTSSRTASTPRASWSAASTTQAPPRWPTRQRARPDAVVTVSTRRRRRRHRAGGRWPGSSLVVARRPLPGRRARCAGDRRGSWATPTPTSSRASAAFGGTRRRMERKGEAGGVRVYDSYAHHPTEISGDLRGRPRAGRRRPAARRLPAPPGLADPRLRCRDGRGAGRRRRGRGLRRLPRPRGPRPHGDRRAGGRRRTSAGRASRLRARPRRRAGGPRRPGRARATWS